MGIKSISIRIDDDLLNKLHFISEYESRSVSSQIRILIRDAINEFETKHGEIILGGKN